MKPFTFTDKTTWISLLILTSGGVLAGCLCVSYFSDQEISYCASLVEQMFAIPTEPFQYFLQQTLWEGILVFLIFLLGFSLLGIPLILFFVYMKGIQIGLVASMLLQLYQIKGIAGIVLMLLPVVFGEMITLYLIASASMQLSGTLFMKISDKSKKISITKTINQKLTIFLCSIACAIATGGLKSTVCLWMIQLFYQLF